LPEGFNNNNNNKTMSNERLNRLAMMHINDDVTVNVDEVMNTFARENPT
jgi:hypothetical protein